MSNNVKFQLVPSVKKFSFSFMLESKVAVNTKFLCKEKQKHPVEVPRWPPNFAPEIKTKLKDFSGKIFKKLN